MTEKERYEFSLSLTTKFPPNEIHSSAWIKEGAVIGNTGFGWIRHEGKLHPMPHAGNVKIERGVVIGANTCIDRAVIGSTFIGEDTKIDNLVHVGHGSVIGKRCLIVAGVVIGGSAAIGDDTFVGMNASIKNKVKIGKGCTIGAGAVVLKDVPDGETWVGNPAKKLVKARS